MLQSRHVCLVKAKAQTGSKSGTQGHRQEGMPVCQEQVPTSLLRECLLMNIQESSILDISGEGQQMLIRYGYLAPEPHGLAAPLFTQSDTAHWLRP